MKQNYWVISCDISRYDIFMAFDNLKKIEWRQYINDIKINDLVYIYIGAPVSKIVYKCIVTNINIVNPQIDDSEYVKDLSDYRKSNRYMELELVNKFLDNECMSYNYLKNNGLKSVRGQSMATQELVDYVECVSSLVADINSYDKRLKKRVDKKENWQKFLKTEDVDNNLALDVLKYLCDCKNCTSNINEIAKYFGVSVVAINDCINELGSRVVDFLGLDNQVMVSGQNRYWNIFFETVTYLKVGGIVTWKLRDELIDVLAEMFDLVLKEVVIVEDLILQFIKENPYDEFCNSIKRDLEVRDFFVNRFSLNNIMSMSLDDYVIGKADISDNGRDSFCYLIERAMVRLGEMRGANVKKFGVWFDKDSRSYKCTKSLGSDLDKAFEIIKQRICHLIVNANNENYEEIDKCEIPTIFKGKIISTYFPEKYLSTFDEDDINKFLNALDIHYDVLEYDTLEKKKKLLKEYKNNNVYLKEYSDYYFVKFLYDTFKEKLKVKNTVSGEIDFNNIKLVDFDYVGNHEIKTENRYVSRNVDQEKINRNKKDVGNRGENAVLEFEKKKLRNLGFDELAEMAYICDNEAIGYDIVSFDEDGKEIHIEVKTNASNKKYMDFYITSNELWHFTKEDNYYIYYLFDIKKKPKCHIVNKEMILNGDFLKPVIYKVDVDVFEK